MRTFFLSAALFSCFVVGATPAVAGPAHHHRHHHARHAARGGSNSVRVTQRHLASLGYYSGAVDGVMGPQTHAAIKSFQRSHNLVADGVVGPRTRAALAAAEVAEAPTLTSAPALNPDAVINPAYAPDLKDGSKTLESRFARVDVNQTGTGANKRYTVTLNDQTILTADGQPAVIGISPTYTMDDEDAVIFTTYSPSDTGCIYRNHVLVMDNAGSKIVEAGNCTHDYTARVDSGSLYITFPEPDDARAVGAVWRLQGDKLTRL